MKIEIDKPVVPAWFDEWYKTFEGDKSKALYHLSRSGRGYALTDSHDEKIEGLNEKLNDLLGIYDRYTIVKEYLSTAILLGYEVEQEPRYYAKIKGWELIRHKISQAYWNLEIDDLFVSDNGELDYGEYHTKMTKTEWNALGINETNADFEEVE